MKGDAHLDLRPIISDITPDAIASGALAQVDTSASRQLAIPSRISRRSLG
ncbi:MAG: hypothetical protein WDN29_07440 [Methylovirgula sp.]